MFWWIQVCCINIFQFHSPICFLECIQNCLFLIPGAPLGAAHSQAYQVNSVLWEVGEGSPLHWGQCQSVTSSHFFFVC